MAINAFKCPDCGKFTRHVEVGFREGMASSGKSVGWQVFGTIQDLTGIGKAFNKISGWHVWKCCECGLITSRNAAGVINY